ncbi:MAG: Hpt domain-containing protein, partial [Pseudomonadales bacterium]
MPERRDYIALDWVAKEIEETLKQARTALENYVEQPEDLTQIRFCLSYVHQVHATLKMLDLPGPVLFGKELELLVSDMTKGELADEAEAQEVLMGGLLRLPMYLERIKAERQEVPAVLQMAVNELRTVRGVELLAEADLFMPVVAPAAAVSPTQAESLSKEEFEKLIRKLRQVFQAAFVDIVRNKRWGANLRSLAKVCQRLRRLSQGHARESFWRIALAILEGMVNRSIAPATAAKNLLKEIDQELKGLQQHGQSYLDQPLEASMLRQLLYVIAKSDAQTPLISEIQKDFGLKEALVSLSAGDENHIDAAALRQVVSVINVEFATIKDVLDIFVRSSSKSMSQLETALPVYKRVADTMAVLDLAEISAHVHNQYKALQSYITVGNTEDEDSLLELASDLVGSEERLQQFADSLPDVNSSTEDPNMAAARERVILEARNVLARAKESIVEYVASDWNRTKLGGVPELLHGISGGLSMVGYARSARIIHNCEAYIRQQIMASSESPHWENLDLLADAISGVDYYLEQMAQDHRNDDPSILDDAASGIAKLGYPETGSDKALQEQTSVDSVEIEAQSEEPESAQDNVIPLPLEKSEHETEAPLASVNKTADSDLIDDEILEIFVEEAEEVHGTLQEFLPQWAKDPDDLEALTEIRRGFHTLKGSGRMVGARDLGAVGWAVEDMLNRVLDDTVVADEPRIAMVSKVVELLPEMIAAFSTGASLDAAAVAQLEAAGAELASAENTLTADMISSMSLLPGSQLERQVVEEQSEEDVLREIFEGEAESHLETILAFVVRARESSAPRQITNDLHRALHTLKGSAHMAEMTAIVEVVTPIEKLVKHLQAANGRADSEMVELIDQASSYVRQGLTHLHQGQRLERFESVDDYLVRVAQLAETAEVDYGIGDGLIERIAAFMGSCADHLAVLEDRRLSWLEQPLSEGEFNDSQQRISYIRQESAGFDRRTMSELADAWSHGMESLQPGERLPEDFSDLYSRAATALTEMLDCLAAGLELEPATEGLLLDLHNYVPDPEADDKGLGLLSVAAAGIAIGGAAESISEDVELVAEQDELSGIEELIDDAVAEELVAEADEEQSVEEDQQTLTVDEAAADVDVETSGLADDEIEEVTATAAGIELVDEVELELESDSDESTDVDEQAIDTGLSLEESSVSDQSEPAPDEMADITATVGGIDLLDEPEEAADSSVESFEAETVTEPVQADEPAIDEDMSLEELAVSHEPEPELEEIEDITATVGGVDLLDEPVELMGGVESIEAETVAEPTPTDDQANDEDISLEEPAVSHEPE